MAARRLPAVDVGGLTLDCNFTDHHTEIEQAAQSHATRLACALLGQLLYERGEMDEADRLLDESYQLGSEGGVVEFMIARYVTGARIKAVRGDRAAAAARLDDGARVTATIGLPRLRAHIENERSGSSCRSPHRRGGPSTPKRSPMGDWVRSPPNSAMRPRSRAARRSTRPGLRPRPRLGTQAPTSGRPRALLQAIRLLVAALSAAGRTDEAKQTLAHIAAQCAELGMIRYLLDGGPQVVALLAELRDDLHSDRWRPTWRAIPPAFLDTMVSEARSTSSGAAAQRAGPT